MTTLYAKERTLQEDITGAVERQLPGVEVLAVELLSPSRFCVYIDHADGVDHALCERVTNVLGGYLDDFTVEVSSPGPGRPLRKPEHFEAALGRRVAVRTSAEVEGRRKFKGEVLAAGDDAVTLGVASSEPIHVPYEAIVRGNLIDEG
jgi:ribosome maturation factor RimP